MSTAVGAAALVGPLLTSFGAIQLPACAQHEINVVCLAGKRVIF